MTALMALDGEVYDLPRVGEDGQADLNDDGTCLGCRARTGQEHGEGCDWAPCPRCGAQQLYCGCVLLDVDVARALVPLLVAFVEAEGGAS